MAELLQMLFNYFFNYKFSLMEFSLKVVGVQMQTVAKPERQPDGSVKQNTEKTCRVVARDESNNVFSFAVPYDEGKSIELDKILSVTVQ